MNEYRVIPMRHPKFLSYYAVMKNETIAAFFLEEELACKFVALIKEHEKCPDTESK